MRLNIHTEPPTMDARKAIDTSSISLIHLCFEGLLRHVKGGSPELALAERVEISSDALTYTFYLRPVRWWDGVPVTAYDFEKTWKTILDPRFPSQFANDLYVILKAEEAKNGNCSLNEVGIYALNEHTLQVKLKHPVPYFLDLVTSHSFLPTPQHIVSIYPKWAESSGNNFVGNGPFKLVSWQHHHQMTFAKNPYYWAKDSVSLDEIHLSIIGDETTALNLFEAGEFDWAGSPLSNLPTDALHALFHQKRLNTFLLSGTYYYIFNVNEPPFNNVNFRRALSYAINRQEIIDNVTQSYQLPATALIPPTMWSNHRGYFKDYDLEKARAYFKLALREMGVSRAQLPEIILSYNTLSSHHQIAQAVQQQWRRAFGIRVQLKNKEWKVFLDELNHKQFQIARMGGIAGFNDPVNFLNQYRYGNTSQNYSGWSNSQFTSFLEQAEQVVDKEARFALLKNAEEILMDEMPIIPIYFYTGSYILKPYVKDVELTELFEANFKLAHIEW